MSSLPSEAEARKILADKRPGEKVKDSFLAIEDFRATRDGQVDLHRGDRVICLDDSDAVWWRGSCRGRVGLFPADVVEPQS